MGIEEIPAHYTFNCDVCGSSIFSKSKYRPHHWSELTFSRHAYDYQGQAVADGTKKLLLCPNCTIEMSKTISSFAAMRNPEAEK